MQILSKPRLALAALALLSCGRNPDTASAYPITAEPCTAADIVAGHLKMTAAPPAAAAALRPGVSVNSRTAINLTGRCAPQVVAADGGTFLMTGGFLVGLTAPVETGAARLAIQPGLAPFDRIKRIAASPGKASPAGTMVAMTDAIDASPASDRYAAVWLRRASSIIGFVDIDRSTGKRLERPLFELPHVAEVAYYMPSPDTNSGLMTVLARVGTTKRIMWIDVGL